MRATTAAAALAAMLLSAGYSVAAPVCGDVNDSGKVTAADALLVLQEAVSLPVDLMCGPAGGIAKTGQTTCYDASGEEIDCDGTGQDGALQRGVARNFTDNGDGTITDNVTSLMWEKLSDDGSIHDADNSYTWANAFESKVATLNSTNFAGHTDWRVPNRMELETLVNLGATVPSTYSAFHSGCAASCTVLTCSCTRSNNHWSSSTYRFTPSQAWNVDFDDGYTFATPKTLSFYVRAVRAGS